MQVLEIVRVIDARNLRQVSRLPRKMHDVGAEALHDPVRAGDKLVKWQDRRGRPPRPLEVTPRLAFLHPRPERSAREQPLLRLRLRTGDDVQPTGAADVFPEPIARVL